MTDATQSPQLPGRQCQAFQARREAAVALGVANGPPVFAERAAGATLTDLDGHDFIDFAGGIGTLNVGHAHPEVVAAVRAGRALSAYLLQHRDVSRLYRAGRGADRSGAGRLAQEGHAADHRRGSRGKRHQVARRATGRQAVVAFENAFHGRTYMALSLTAKAPAYKSGFGPFANEVYRAPFPVRYRSGLTDEACARAAFEQFRRLVESEITPGQVAAVIIEPIQERAVSMWRHRPFCSRCANTAVGTASC